MKVGIFKKTKTKNLQSDPIIYKSHICYNPQKLKSKDYEEKKKTPRSPIPAPNYLKETIRDSLPYLQIYLYLVTDYRRPAITLQLALPRNFHSTPIRAYPLARAPMCQWDIFHNNCTDFPILIKPQTFLCSSSTPATTPMYRHPSAIPVLIPNTSCFMRNLSLRFHLTLTTEISHLYDKSECSSRASMQLCNRTFSHCPPNSSHEVIRICLVEKKTSGD